MNERGGEIAGSPPGRSTSPSLREAAGLTRVVKVLLCCWMGVTLVVLASHWALLRFFESVQQGAYLSRTEAAHDAALLDGVAGLLRVGQAASFILTAILFLRWVHRANENARRLGAVDMQFTPAWAVGWYFVPIASLVMPYQVMKEIWNASDNPADWRSRRAHPVVRWWWGLFLTWSVIGYVALFISSSARGDLTESIVAARLFLVFDASAIAAGIAALFLVTRLRALQVARVSSG